MAVAGCGAGSPPQAESPPGGSAGQIVVEHTLGTTTLPKRPERVVTLTDRDTDTALALGVVPVGIRTLYGFDSGAGPWSQDRLGGATPTVWKSRELNFEGIAALRPDLIVNANGDADRTVYDRLSAIAPTIGLPKGQVPYGASTESTTLLVAQALGLPEQGRRLVDDLQDFLRSQAAAHPEFSRVTASYLDVHSSGILAYPQGHLINRVLTDLGFGMPDMVRAIPAGTKSFDVSPESVAGYAGQVMVVYPYDRTLADIERQVPTFAALDAVREGRVVLLTDQSFSAASVLSLRYGVDRLVPEIARSLQT
ncbi:MAG: hypothetical protein ABS81_22130 [Pseudonocardia sp. SCN 72-86]|nr:MAG: hypothetical protein ABS81_22130 [Pseudonocardia sp. SCN 72-86]